MRTDFAIRVHNPSQASADSFHIAEIVFVSEKIRKDAL